MRLLALLLLIAFPALTDVGYMTKAASTADVACDFEFILVDE